MLVDLEFVWSSPALSSCLWRNIKCKSLSVHVLSGEERASLEEGHKVMEMVPSYIKYTMNIKIIKETIVL